MGQGHPEKRAGMVDRNGIRTLLLAMKPHVTEEMLQAMKCLSQRNILSFAHGVARHMLSRPVARWWIEHKDDPAYQGIEESIRLCAEHYTKKKAFK